KSRFLKTGTLSPSHPRIIEEIAKTHKNSALDTNKKPRHPHNRGAGIPNQYKKYYSSIIVYRLWLTTVFSNISCSSKLSLIVMSTMTELSFTFSTLPFMPSNDTMLPTFAATTSSSTSAMRHTSTTMM